MNEERERIATVGVRTGFAMTDAAGGASPSPTAKTLEELTAEQLGGEIRVLTTQARKILVGLGIEIGHRLVLAKEKVPHGEWMDWVARETDLSQSNVNRMMRLYHAYADRQETLFEAEINSSTLKNLSISNALELLALPESERESFAAEVGAAELSTRELKAAIAARKAAEERALAAERALHELEEGEGLAVAELSEKLDEARRETRAAKEEARKAAEGVAPYRERAELAENTVATLREQVRELEERPVATVTVKDEQAIEEAVRAARAKCDAETAEKLNALQKRLSAAEKAKEKAEKEAKKASEAEQRARRDAEGGVPYKEKAEAAEKAAEAAAKEAEAARRELEEARKQLKASDGKVTKFGVYFKTMQEDFNRCVEILPEIGETDRETAGKLRVGMRALMEKMLERIGE